MKRLFTVLLLMCAMSFSSFAQTLQVEADPTLNYQKFVRVVEGQEWQLVGVAHNDYYTVVGIDIYVTNNAAASFNFPTNLYISGSFGRLNPVRLEVDGGEKTLGNWIYYNKGCKGRRFRCLVYFPRIPAGVANINYFEPNFIEWWDIPFTNNPSTTTMSEWTEALLMDYWSKNPCLPIEGIYTFIGSSNPKWWGNSKHTLAVKKNGYQYQLIYLRGSNPKIWKEGEIKGAFVPTAKVGLFKATEWYYENKIVNGDFYLQFSADGEMRLSELNSETTADFLRLYPSFEETGNGGNSGAIATTLQRASRGSGIFVASKILATNQHVIEGASTIKVLVKDGETVATYSAKVLVSDKVNDLALLSIDDEKFKGIGEIPYVISSSTKDVGSKIYTMGYPLTQYMGEEPKVTDGIISSKTGYQGEVVTYQISAAIQKGSSGGPVFDEKGCLVGISNGGILGAQNVGYAIKGLYLRNLIESSPVSIPFASKNQLAGLNVTEQIKKLSKFVVIVESHE